MDLNKSGQKCFDKWSADRDNWFGTAPLPKVRAFWYGDCQAGRKTSLHTPNRSLQVSVKSDRIPVYAGDHLVEMCDQSRAEALAGASNVRVARAHRTRLITRVTIAPAAIELAAGGASDSLHLTYKEQLGGHGVPVLRRPAVDGGYVKWADTDSFNPLRFNPDRLPKVGR